MSVSSPMSAIVDLPSLARPRLARPLTPEEDAIGDPDEGDDEIDDTLPADLWF